MYNQSPNILPSQIRDVQISSTVIMQINSQGIANKKADFLGLKFKEKLNVICIQETMLLKQTNFNLKNFNELPKERHTNYRTHGGVAIIINENIPHQKLILNTPLQAIAAKIIVG